MRFWDSSAIVPLVIREDSSEAVQALLADDADIVVWWGTMVECRAALSRKRREGTPDERMREALERLSLLAQHWITQAPIRALRERAIGLADRHPLRAADSLQLAGAMLASVGETQLLALVSLDDRLRAAAEAEGFTLLPEALP